MFLLSARYRDGALVQLVDSHLSHLIKPISWQHSLRSV